MPQRRETLKRQVSGQIIERYRELIHAGCPWLYQIEGPGRMDLIGLVTGSYFDFGTNLCKDDESKREVWNALRKDILEEHIRRRPGRRPSAWWQFEAPEPKRVVHTEPDWKACGPEGYQEYECGTDYLKRLNLLTPDEKKLFKKYQDILIVRVASGEYGKCDQCWREAEEIGRRMEFDLTTAVIQYNYFWLPADLVFECEHNELYRTGIFDPDWRD
jgi:hypothetical protein